MTLTLDFQGQILKILYLRNGRADWHGTKGMWIDRMLDPHCDFELDPTHDLDLWFSRSNFQKSRNSGKGCPIHMERKGYESIGWYTFFVTLSYDLDLGFSRSKFENAVSQEWEGQLTWNQRDVSRLNVGPMLWLLNFQCQILKWLYPRNGRADWHEMKRIWIDRVVYLLCDLELWPWPWIFKVKFKKKLYHSNKRVNWHGTKRM